ncbi:MAG: DUF2306 domain-containing protein [Acidimicrobiales bacterium]|nr:DUF2306 domain-containing protein [Acidimicrobiales bacterium]
MTIAYEVLGVYALLAIWAILLVVGVRTKNYWPFLGFGVAIAIYLNTGYFVRGQPDAIASFIGIYDVFDNLGLARDEGAPALAQCADNACTVWGDRYVNHPSWGVAFYDRFLNGPDLRKNLLYAHIFFNTVAFVLLHVQLFRPGTGSYRAAHRKLGRVSFASLTAGTVCAVWLASEHGSVSEYGGNLAMLGFFSMSAFVYGTAVQGLRTARSGDLAAHRMWMIRYAGAMWGAFWLFRVMLVITGPLLRNYETVSLLISIWFSAPLGILIAEKIRLRAPERERAPQLVS